MVQQQTASQAVATAETASETARDAFVAARREEILDAARRAFIARGFHATSMQQIAAESGVSAGNIYRYFPNKEALIASVCEGCGEAARQMFASASAQFDSPNAALGALGDAIWADIPSAESRDQTLLELETLLVAARNPDVGELSKRSVQVVIESLTDLVAGAQAADEIDSALDARGFATMLYALVVGMRQLQVQLGDDADAATVWATQRKLLAPFERRPTAGAD